MIAPDAFPPFFPRTPWLTGDLQTIRNYLRRPACDLSAFAFKRLELPLRDGDRLLGDLNLPDGASQKPLVVLIHGLTGCSTGTYMLVSARHLLRHGYPVLRLNLRGAGPTRRLCRRQYHAGRTEDFREALAALPEALTARGIVAVGYSLGGNMLLKYLGEQGANGPVRAAASISAPIDLAAASLCLRRPRNRLYHSWLLRRMQEEALAGDGFSAAERDTVRAVRSVYDFDDRVVAPRNGFASADDYYTRCSAFPFVSSIGVPTLVVHALDDPWIPSVTYQQVDWEANSHLVPLLPAQGGHVGFHSRGTRLPWHDRCLEIFLKKFF
ncbi:MAG TPA: alpha/beta fold hydrolase [Alphaproteobacteria bacterium]|nr:alpha/beta fold hydrolase [Alphaproteobacteria bacterium]